MSRSRQRRRRIAWARYINSYRPNRTLWGLRLGGDSAVLAIAHSGQEWIAVRRQEKGVVRSEQPCTPCCDPAAHAEGAHDV